MDIFVEKLTNLALARRACIATLGVRSSKIKPKDLYRSEHSPLRTQLFWIEMSGIPSFVSVHLVRHKIGVEHFVQSLRDDRGGRGDEGRNTPVNHSMLINAQALMTIAHARLCNKSHSKTIEVMKAIAGEIWSEDPDLYPFLIPKCKYLGRCIELKPCGQKLQ